MCTYIRMGRVYKNNIKNLSSLTIPRIPNLKSLLTQHSASTRKGEKVVLKYKKLGLLQTKERRSNGPGPYRRPACHNSFLRPFTLNLL